MRDSGDREILQILRRNGPMTVTQLVGETRVTATAIRNRLNRLMAQDHVDRSTEQEGRGRPSHRYCLTDQGHAVLGQNYTELALTMWSELRGFEDRSMAMKLLRRVAEKLAHSYRRQLPDDGLRERLSGLSQLLSERGIDVEIDDSGGLPVLRQHSCPYHELAEMDRTVCGIEKRLLEMSLDNDIKLSQCRLDGHQCCEFEICDENHVPQVGLLPS